MAPAATSIEQEEEEEEEQQQTADNRQQQHHNNEKTFLYRVSDSHSLLSARSIHHAMRSFLAKKCPPLSGASELVSSKILLLKRSPLSRNAERNTRNYHIT